MFLALLVMPWLYIALAAGASAALPPVDYKAISQEQSRSANPKVESVNQIPDPAQVPQAKSEEQK